MKTLARKVEDFITAALADVTAADFPVFKSTGSAEITRPCVRIQTVTGWQPGFLYGAGERTAVVTVTVESNADDTDGDDHDALAAMVEADLGDEATVTSAAATIPIFTLKLWVPGDSQNSVEERVKQTIFNYTARIRDDNSNR